MNVFWDFLTHELVESLTSGSVLQRLDLILRDQYPTTLYLCQPSSGSQAYVAQEAPSGWAIKFAIKTGAGIEGDPLVVNGTWTLSGSGASATYSATLDLNVTELIAAVAAATTTDSKGHKYLDAIAEFVLQDASGNNRDSTQVACRIVTDVYRTGQSQPTAAQLTPWLEEYTNGAGQKCLRLRNSDGEVLAAYAPAGGTP